MIYVVSMYITMIPLMIGGITNMIFIKTKLYNKYKYPIDGYKVLSDNKRIFGDNKTIIGFISMIIFVCVYQIVWGAICNQFNLNTLNDWYLYNNNNFKYNIQIGIITGFIYVISELPNSFIKRRIGIEPGKTTVGIKGLTFLILDQIDSLIGIFLYLVAVSKISIHRYFSYIVLGAVTHIALNFMLHKLKIRRNI